MTRIELHNQFVFRTILAAVTAASLVSSVMSVLTVQEWNPPYLALGFVAYYPWSFSVTIVFGVPGFLLARRFRWDTIAVAVLYGALIGLAFAYWIGGGRPHPTGSAIYAGLGAAAATVFILVQKKGFRLRTRTQKDQ